MSKSNLHLLAKLAFILILLDSFMTYTGRQITGVILPVNLIVPIILTIVIVIKGKSYFTLDKSSLMWLVIAMFGFTTGILTIPEYGLQRVFEIGSATMAFITGYIFAKWARDEDDVSNSLIIVGVLYATVCIIAVTKLMPQYFPVIIKLWAHNGHLIERPEVTTDQNFQIFYLLPGIILFMLPFKKIRFSIATYTLLGSLYTLAALQTRSGLLIAFGLVGLITITPIWTKSLGRSKLYIIPAISVIGTIVFLPKIIQLASGIIIRFTETDYSTGLGRLHSFTYLFDKIYNPLWWIPRGTTEFVDMTGNIPHSNPTAVFLDGGILSLVSWSALIIIPLITLTKLFLKSRLDNVSTMFFIGAIGSLLAQMSLSVPLMDQIWLWAGISNGIIARYNLLQSQPNGKSLTTKNKVKVLNDERYPRLRETI